MPFVLALGLVVTALREEREAIKSFMLLTRSGVELSGYYLELGWVLSFSPRPPCTL